MSGTTYGIVRAVWALLKRNKVRVVLGIPTKTMEAIDKLKLQPSDGFDQVCKDAFQTHANVRAAMQTGGRIMVHRGAEITPLPLGHLLTPEKKRSGWMVIPGDKE